MSIDYRSVFIFATAEKVTDFQEKRTDRYGIVEGILPGHHVRLPKKGNYSNRPPSLSAGRPIGQDQKSRRHGSWEMSLMDGSE